jgi:hypothetical protein
MIMYSYKHILCNMYKVYRSHYQKVYTLHHNTARKVASARFADVICVNSALKSAAKTGDTPDDDDAYGGLEVQA